MAIEMTFHGFRPKDAAGWGTGYMPGQVSDAVVVLDGAISPAIADGGVYRIAAFGGCRVRIGEDPADATGGEYWPDGHVELRTLAKGQKVAVDAVI